MAPTQKSTVEDIRKRFDADVERFSNLETGQSSTMDAAYCLDLVTAAAAAVTPRMERVLDVGCGAGNYSLKLRQQKPAAKFTLVDLSAPMLARAAERLGSSAEVQKQGDVRFLSFPDAHFDVILAAAVLHHLRTPKEWEQVFAQFYTWLKPGGSVWVFDLVRHENPALQALMWARYGAYLEALNGPDYRQKVFDYIELEDSPTSLDYQLTIAKSVGFANIDVLHKNGCFAAYGLMK